VRALVTGAGGFLGSSVCRRLLRAGIEVRALVRPDRPLPVPGAERFEGDIGDDVAVAAAVNGMDCVVHTAARVQTSGRWEDFAEANVRGTRRLLRAAPAAGVGRIVHISSLSVYAVPHDGVRITEDSCYESEGESRGHYSRSKLAADRVVMDAARRGVAVVNLRPGLLYGPGKRPPVARQSFSVAGLKLLLASPSYRLPLTYVDNVADAVLLAATTDAAAGQAFTIVDANTPQDEYVGLYRAASGEHWRPVFLPVGAVAAGAWVMERALRLARRRSPVTYHQVRRATVGAVYDCSKAERILGWRPAITIEEGLRRTFESLRDESPRAGAPAMASAAS